MNKYDIFKKLQELTALRIGDTNTFQKILPRGSFELHDYDTGFICVDIKFLEDYHNPGQYVVRLYFSNIDDGAVGGWSKPMSKSKAQTLTARIAEEVFEEMVQLPSMDELNQQLQQYGIFITHE